jgi:hypothetical protein
MGYQQLGKSSSCSTSSIHTTSEHLSQQHVDTEQLNQRLDALLAVKRKVQAMAPQNEKKKAIKHHKPHQWWYLNPQYYADNPTHNTRVPPYASHECKLRPSNTPAFGVAGVPTGKTYEQLKHELVAKSRNGHRNRARRAFKKMWTVTGNMWRDSHNQTLALIRKQEAWTRRKLESQERQQAYQTWLEEQQRQRSAAEPSGQIKQPTLIERLLRTAPEPQETSAAAEQLPEAPAAATAAAEAAGAAEEQQGIEGVAPEQQQQQQQQGQGQGQQP